MNTYILSYNVLETKISFGQLQAFIKDNRRIQQWYSPFLGTFVIKSSEGLQPLADSFRGLFEGAPFILSYAMPTHMGGAQTPAVWSWINEHGFAGWNPTQSALEEKP